MLSRYLFKQFGLMVDDAVVSCHDLEDFIMHFMHHEDMNHVLVALAMGAPLPLVWHLWRRTSMASGGSFRYTMLVGLTQVPLHARNASTTQTILNRARMDVEGTGLRDVLAENDHEFSSWHGVYILYSSKREDHFHPITTHS